MRAGSGFTPVEQPNHFVKHVTLSLALRSSSLERRGRSSYDEKMRIVEETLAPGARVTEVARRNGVAALGKAIGHRLPAGCGSVRRRLTDLAQHPVHRKSASTFLHSFPLG
jgi:Transposase